MTGYHDPPAGIEEEREGQFYNVYFPGQWISMQQALFPDAVEYDDGESALRESYKFIFGVDMLCTSVHSCLVKVMFIIFLVFVVVVVVVCVCQELLLQSVKWPRMCPPSCAGQLVSPHSFCSMCR